MDHKLFFQKFTDNQNSKWLLTSFWIALFFVLTCALQIFVPYPIDDDTAYHFSVARLIGKYGILHSFPWTTFSWQFDHYADKELIFHLLFLPVTGLGFASAARVVGAAAGGLILVALYGILRAEKVRHPGIWVLLMLTCGEFVFRLALVRPHLLSITLALIVLWAYARRKFPLLAVAAVLYPLCYVAFWQIPLILIFSAGAARIASRERICWKPVLVLLGGLAAGIVLHPDTVNLLRVNWIHMSDILFQNAWGHKAEFDNLAKEFNPYTFGEWVRYLAVITMMMGAALTLSWRSRRENSLPLAFAVAAAVFGLLTAKSLRFIEYFVPFSVAATAIAARTLEKRLLAPALLGVSLLYMLLFGTIPFKIIASKTPYLEPAIAEHFEKSIPAGSQVFTCGWDYTGNLMLALPERRFIVAADPTLFYKKDPGLYSIWRRIPLDAPIDSGEAIRRLFRSRFVVCRNFQAYWPFFETLEKDPSVKTLFADNKWVLFDLQGAHSVLNAERATDARIYE